jgi:hypothetical protein
VFEPATTKALMAALLVHDLHAGQPAAGHPWQDEAHAAAHGGLWRMAYAPRSALSLAALLGYAAARNQARGSLPEGLVTWASCSYEPRPTFYHPRWSVSGALTGHSRLNFRHRGVRSGPAAPTSPVRASDQIAGHPCRREES